MDDQRLGAALRAARIRRSMTQQQLAMRCRLSASSVSLIERGHLESLSIRALRRLAAALDVRVEILARMRTGDLDRIMNAGHVAMHDALASHLSALPGWVHSPEVSFAVFRERGVIDILAFHAPTGSLLVIEIKTELVSVEDLLTTMDVRLRLATRIASERGWRARSVSGWIVFADARPNRRRAALHAATLRAAYPAGGHEMRAWLRQPEGTIRALSFWSISNAGGVNQLPALRRG